MDRVLTEEVKLMAKQLGAKLVGIASADRFEGAPEGFRPADMLPSARSVVVVAIPLLYGVIEKSKPFKPYETWIHAHTLKHGMPNREYAAQYVSLNTKMDRLVQELAYALEERGYYAFPIHASTPTAGMGIEFSPEANVSQEEVYNEYKRGDFSHRHAAVLAGMGEIGLNNLFMTAEYGPRVRLASVITDAPLVPDDPFTDVLCKGKKDPKKCNVCIKACPFGALPEPTEPIADPMGYNVVHKFRCFLESGKSLQKVSGNWVHAICGICIKTCPVGKKGPHRAKAGR